MRKLYFDTETTGLWLYGPDNPADGPGQPHVIEFAWTIVDGETEVEAHEYLIKPSPDWVMNEKALATHGITPEMCEADGQPLGVVAAKLHAAFQDVDLICAYGITFDMKGARASFRRAGLPDLYEETKEGTFCVMRAATNVCRMAPTDRMVKAGRSGQWKTPKLSEAAQILLGLDHTEKAHRALADVRMTMAVHKHLHMLGYPAAVKRAKSDEEIDFGPGRDSNTGQQAPDATMPRPAPADDLGVI